VPQSLVRNFWHFGSCGAPVSGGDFPISVSGVQRPVRADRLRLFDILFKQPLTTAALAERLSLSAEVTCRLLDAAFSLGLVERRGRSLYGWGQLGAALVGNRAALSLIEHQPLLYADLQDPVALRPGRRRSHKPAARTIIQQRPHQP
jgi:hypothetical protein